MRENSPQETHLSWEDCGILQISYTPTFGMQHMSLSRISDPGISVMSSVRQPQREAKLSELPEASVITQARSDCIHLQYELRTTH